MRYIREESKSIQDSVHGQITLDYPLNLIVDTKEFKRLSNLKQLGFAHSVYPNGTHTRFCHSLGTCSFAIQLLENLQKNTPELKISSADRLCVATAALCHDLGHGPFSHVFDGPFREKVKGNWSHEKLTVSLLDRIFSRETIRRAFSDFFGEGAAFENNIKFIKELIVSKKQERFDPEKGWIAKGRPVEKSFLYDIVSNENDGFDVDKLDYLLRDSASTGVAIPFNKNCIERLMKNCRVMEDPETSLFRICYEAKVADTLNAIGQARQDLHCKVYQHKTVVAIEDMAVKAMACANSELQFIGDNKNVYPLSKTVNDMGAYLRTNDSVLTMISNSSSSSKNMEDARALLDAIDLRQVPRNLRVFLLPPEKVDEIERENGFIGDVNDESRLEAAIRSRMKQKMGDEYIKDDIIILAKVMHRGRGRRHPMSEVLFYDAHRLGARPYHLNDNWITAKVPAPQSTYLYVYVQRNVQSNKKSQYAEVLMNVANECGFSSFTY